MLTDKQKKEYVKHPYQCPYCKSDDLETMSRDADYNIETKEVICGGCERTWKEIYTLTSIEED